MNVWLLKNDVNNYASLKINMNDLKLYEEKLKRGMHIYDLNDNSVEIVYKKRLCDRIEFADVYCIDNFPYCFMINERTKKIFENELNIEAQYLEIKVLDPKEKLYIMSLLRKKDIIDYEKSEYSLRLNRYVGEIYKYVFKDEVRNEYAFKCFQDGILNSVYKYCTDKFKDIVEKNNITGLKFEKIFEIE